MCHYIKQTSVEIFNATRQSGMNTDRQNSVILCDIQSNVQMILNSVAYYFILHKYLILFISRRRFHLSLSGNCPINHSILDVRKYLLYPGYVEKCRMKCLDWITVKSLWIKKWSQERWYLVTNSVVLDLHCTLYMSLRHRNVVFARQVVSDGCGLSRQVHCVTFPVIPFSAFWYKPQ